MHGPESAQLRLTVVGPCFSIQLQPLGLPWGPSSSKLCSGAHLRNRQQLVPLYPTFTLLRPQSCVDLDIHPFLYKVTSIDLYRYCSIKTPEVKETSQMSGKQCSDSTFHWHILIDYVTKLFYTRNSSGLCGFEMNRVYTERHYLQHVHHQCKSWWIKMRHCGLRICLNKNVLTHIYGQREKSALWKNRRLSESELNGLSLNTARYEPEGKKTKNTDILYWRLTKAEKVLFWKCLPLTQSGLDLV